MDSSVIEIILFLIVVLGLYKFLTKNNDFFKKRGVKFIKPIPLFGSTLDLLSGKEDGVSVMLSFCRKFPEEKLIGIFMFLQPMFLLNDAEVIKQIAVKDFDHFVNHNKNLSKAADGIFAKSVLLLEDNPWREMRHMLTPIFTSSKLKTMFHHLTSCVTDLTDHFDEMIQANGKLVIESKEMFGRFTADCISSTTLGFKGDCIKDKNSKVYELAQSVHTDIQVPLSMLKFMLIPSFPKLAKYFQIKVFRDSIHDFFKKYVTDEIARRESEGITTALDVVQLLIQAKNGQLRDESDETKVVHKKYTNWDDDELVAAQVFIFFAGGFDTISAVMETMSWELAKNPEIQKKLIEEIDEVSKSLDGKTISYEALNQMKFLEMVVNETLRKWPPTPSSIRECNQDYRLTLSNGTEVLIEKGDSLMIPIRAIQHDPKYFENPSKFDPYRFSDENKHKIVPGTFLAFGYGPRMCLGNRLALLETKLAFFALLSKYSIEVCDKTPAELKYTMTTALKDPVFVELKPRKKSL